MMDDPGNHDRRADQHAGRSDSSGVEPEAENRNWYDQFAASDTKQAADPTLLIPSEVRRINRQTLIANVEPQTMDEPQQLGKIPVGIVPAGALNGIACRNKRRDSFVYLIKHLSHRRLQDGGSYRSNAPQNRSQDTG
jgi:hypothetical protein